MSYSDPLLEGLQRLHTHLWGQDVTNVVQEGENSYSIIDLKLFLIPQNNSPKSILFIRDEYRLAYDTILKETLKSTEGRLKSHFLVTGQPGIGKTMFSLYVLARRLQERQPVAYQIDASRYALFDKHGVALHPGASYPLSIPDGAWALSDSSPTQREPCIDFSYQQAYVIRTTSPAFSLWKSWAKEFNAREYVMDVWSLEEIRTLLTICNLDVQRGVALFRKYGPMARPVIHILTTPTQEDTYLRSVESGATELAREFSTVLPSLKNLDFSSKISSKIVAVKPDLSRSRQPVLFIPTQFLASTLGVALSSQTAAQKHGFFTMLSSHPSLRGAAGWLFENYAHVCFSAPNSTIHGYLPNHPRPHRIPTPSAMIAGSAVLRTVQAPFDFYWRPREPNFDGVDALIRSGSVVWALQFTISASHSSATDGLSKVREIMNHKRGLKWRLVIVGPDLTTAESARDCQRLTGRWANTPVYACELPLGTFTEAKVQQLQANLNEDEMYPMD